MNLPAKKTETLLKYGTLSPTIWQRMGLQKSIPFYEVLSNTAGTGKDFWSKSFHAFDAEQKQLITEGFNRNTVVNAVVTKIARQAAQAPWAVYNVVNDKAFNRYKALQKQEYSPEQYFEMKRWRLKALEPNETHSLNAIFQNPNEQQSSAEYMESLVSFKLITGDAYEYGNMLKKGIPGELWALPSQFMKIKNNGSFPMRVTGYELSFGTSIINLDTRAVMHSKYFNPNWDSNGNHLYGISPLNAAWLSILSDNSAREALVEQLQNRGARGIFTFKSDVIKDYAAFTSAKGAIKEEWGQNAKEYRDKIIPMFGEGQWHNVGLSIRDMAAVEVCDMTLKDICNAFGVSDLLFNNQKASTKDNLKIARRDFITAVVIPVLATIRDGRNRKLKSDWNPNRENIVVDFDSTIYTELEADKVETVDWMKKAGVFTDNEIRQQLNFESLDYAYADEPWKSNSELPVSMVGKQQIQKHNG